LKLQNQAAGSVQTPRAGVERRHAVEVAGEAADLGQKRLGVDFGLNCRKANQAQRNDAGGDEAQPFRPGSLTMRVLQRCELAIGELDDGARHGEGRGAPGIASQARSRSGQLFFLRRLPTNFTSSIVLS
jgi:hypothetical protein